MLGGRAVQRPVDRVPAEEQVEVVLEGDADAAVQLHAVLESSAPYSPMYALAALTSSAASAAPDGDRAPRRRR